MSVVIARLFGGLGNQMFQYAAALALARRYGVPAAFEQRSIGRGSTHDVGLQDAFDLDLPRPTPLQWHRVLPLLGGIGSHRFRRRLAGFLPGRVVVEPSIRYWPGFESVIPPCYLVGHWASPKYFAPVAAELRNRLRFRPAPGSRAADLAAELASGESVAVHVRGGDYLRDARTLAHHGACSAQYYEAALARIESLVANPRFYVFSDDPERARAVVPARADVRFLPRSAGPRCHEDLEAMSHARHHVVANSTFGWWGAWLATNPRGVRIAPATWLAGTGYRGEDLVPLEWIRLEDPACETGSSRTHSAAGRRAQAVHAG